MEWIRLEHDDFYKDASRLRIVCRFCDMTDEEASHFTEWLGYDLTEEANPKLCLNVILDVRRKDGKISPFDVKAGIDDDGTKNIYPDPEKAHIYVEWVEKIINNRLNLTQSHRLLKEMNMRNSKDKFYSKSMVDRILKCPIYCGILKYGEYEESEGKWDTIISKSQWYKLQEILKDKSRPALTKHNLPYRRMMKCGKCGLSVTAYSKVKKSGKSYYYLVCTKKNGNCGNDPITINELEELLIHELRKIELNKEQIERLKELVNAKLDNEFNFEINKRKEISNELNRISEKLDRLLSLRIENELSKEEYEANKEPLNKRQIELTEIQNSIKFNRDEVRTLFENFFDLTFSLEKVFWKGTGEERTRLIKAIGEDMILEDKKIRLNFKEPWQSLIAAKNVPESKLWGGRWDSPDQLK